MNYLFLGDLNRDTNTLLSRLGTQFHRKCPTIALTINDEIWKRKKQEYNNNNRQMVSNDD